MNDSCLARWRRNHHRRVLRRHMDGNPPHVWCWRPQWYWYGWPTLFPIYFGWDEYDRRTIMLGWTITGRIIVAVGR